MTNGPLTMIHPVRDLEAATTTYAALLGVEPDFVQPYYVSFTVAGHHVGLDPHGHAKGLTAPLVYWHVDDIAQRVKELTAAGAEVKDEAHDVGQGRLIGTVADADGNVLGLLQP